MERLKNWHLWMNLLLAVLVIFWPAAHDFLLAHPEISAMALAALNAILGILTHGSVQLVDQPATDAAAQKPQA